MSAIEDRPTTAENYARATESSNLKVSSERRGDADVLIVAGWTAMTEGETLGATLSRLRTEFDGARAKVHGTSNSTTTDRLLILMALKTLPRAREELGAHAVAYATRQSFMQPDADVLKIAGRVLDVFLDPKCPKCSGRGFSGGGRHEESGPQVLCRPCGGTTLRRGQLGKTDAERHFAAGLLSDIEAKASQFEQQMARRMREGE